MPESCRIVAVRALLVSALAPLIASCGSGGDGGADRPAMPAPAANRAPVAGADVAAVTAAGASIAVLANDMDPDGDALRLIAVSAPASGSATIDDRGTARPDDDTIVYVPSAAFVGTDRFSYTIADDDGGSASGQVTVSVTASEAPLPVIARDDAATTPAGEPTSIDVLANDSGSGDLTITALIAPAHGSVVRADNGTPDTQGDDWLVYAPRAGFAGTDSFLYTVTDETGSATAAVNVTVVAPVPATTPPTAVPPAAPAPGLIGGSVIKGPVAGARIALYPIDASGQRATATPVARTVTDAGGNWSLLDPLPGRTKLVVAAAGTFVDEAHAVADLDARRRVALSDDDALEGVLPAADNYLALTAYTNALLIKSRYETQGGDFIAVYANNRQAASDAFGFDIVATVPADPVDFNPVGEESGRRYALALGGAANALNAIGARLGLSVPRTATVRALVRDLSECVLNGEAVDGPVDVQLGATSASLPGDVDLNLEILRFRNNRYAEFGATPLPAIDPSICGRSGALPDQTPPTITGIAPVVTLANPGGAGLPVTDPAIQAILAAAVTSDDRDPSVTVSNDAPARFEVGVTRVMLQATDQAGNQVSQFVDITLVDGRSPQVISAIGAMVGTEGTAFSADLSGYFTDPDGDTLTFTASGLPTSIALDGDSGALTGTLSNYDAVRSPFAVTVTASDGQLSVSDTYTFGVVGANAGPLRLASIGDRTLALAAPVALALGDYFYDPDGDTLTYSLSGLPAGSGLSFEPASGLLTGTAAAIDIALSPLTLTLSASDGSVATQDQFRLRVTDNNQAPRLLDGASAPGARQDQTYFLDLGTVFTDPDGDALTFSAVGLPASLLLDPLLGTLEGRPDNADALAGPYDITFSASDGAARTDWQVTLQVANVNDPPQVDTSAGVLFATQDLPFTADLSAGFSDIDNDPLTFSASGLPAPLTLAADSGIVSGTPDAGVTAGSPYTIVITASDGTATASDTLMLNVAVANRPPQVVAAPAPLVGAQGIPLSAQFAASFADPDGNALSYAVAGLAAGSGLSFDTVSGTLAGVPTNDDWLTSPQTLTISASDGALGVATTVTLNVANRNDAPQVVVPIGARSATQGQPFLLDVSANFVDIDNDALSFTATGLPASLTLEPGSGVILGTPTSADVLASPLLVTVVASDGALAANNAFVLTIGGPNDAPRLVAPFGPQSGAQGTPFALLLSNAFSDPNGDDLAFAVSGLPAGTGLLLDPAAGLLAGTPTNADWLASPLTLSVSATDGSLSAGDTFVLTVANLNDAPFEVQPVADAVAYEGVPFELAVGDHLLDPDGDVLLYAISGLPGGTGLVIDADSGIVSGTPTAADAAASPMLVTITASDPQLLSGTTRFTLTLGSLADVDIAIEADELAPVVGETVRIEVRLDNMGPAAANGIAVLASLPAGLTYQSHNIDSGSYDVGSGAWTGIALADGDDTVLEIDAVASATPITVLRMDVEISASSAADPDTRDSDTLDLVVVDSGTQVDWLGGDPSGPTDWAVPGNWSGGSVPGDFDDVAIDDRPFDPVLDQARSARSVMVDADAVLDLNGHTLTVFGELSADGVVTGPCPGSVVRMLAGSLSGAVPGVDIAGYVETGATVGVACDLEISGGRLRLRDDVDVGGDFATRNDGLLEQHNGTSILRVGGNVVFDGGDHARLRDGKSLLRNGTLEVGGDFTQTGNPFSFSAEGSHTVVLNGSGPQTVSMAHPDNTNPEVDVPAASGSRFAHLRIDKDATDGAVDFVTDTAVLLSLEIGEAFSPTLTSSTGKQIVAGGVTVEDAVGPQPYSATFDGLRLTLVDGDDLEEFDGVLFTAMPPALPQISVRRSDLQQLHNGKSFSGLTFDTLPDLASGGAFIAAENTDTNPANHLSLEVRDTYPRHGTPWTTTVGSFSIVWGQPDDDSDEDGVGDADEFALSTSPLDPDSDDDGLGDGLEVEIGADPFTPAQTVLYVDALGGSDGNDGSSWAQALQTNTGLMAGPLASANGTPGEPVHVLYATGSYDGLVLTGKQHVVLAGSLGPDTYYPRPPYDAVIGQGATTGIALDDSQDILLFGLRLSGANNPGGNGGGLFVGGATGSHVQARNVEIVGNSAGASGGGFFVDAGSQLTVADALIRANVAGGGGAGSGGGGGAVFGGLTLERSIVADNRAPSFSNFDGGGGLLIRNSAATHIADSLIVANYSGLSGGGLLIDSAGQDVVLSNSLIAGNAADFGWAGGVRVRNIDGGPAVVVTSNTIAWNQALATQDVGGGVRLTNAPLAAVRDNILAENQDNTLAGAATDDYQDDGPGAVFEFNTLSRDPSGGAGANQQADPLFERGFYLASASPAVNAGSTTADVAGLDAPYTTHVDGDADAGALDHGFHYRQAAYAEVEDVQVVSSSCSAPGELTMIIRPRTDDPSGSGGRVAMGPGHVVTVATNALTPTGMIDDRSTLTSLRPDGNGTRLAIDEGTGDYRFTVVDVSDIPDQVRIDVIVDHAGDVQTVNSPDIDTIPGC